MRHKLAHRKLNRTASHRKAMFANMASSLSAVIWTHVASQLLVRATKKCQRNSSTSSAHAMLTVYAVKLRNASPLIIARDPRAKAGDKWLLV